MDGFGLLSECGYLTWILSKYENFCFESFLDFDLWKQSPMLFTVLFAQLSFTNTQHEQHKCRQRIPAESGASSQVLN